MTTESSGVDWSRAKAILGDVLDAPPEARAGELERLCDGDAELRAAVRRLIEALDDGTDFFPEPDEPPITPEPHHTPGERIGKYRIVRELGHGGMGTVYEAIQDQPRRTVALKLLHASISSHRITERFVREAELLARLDHPNIARVYDAGSHEGGFRATPYFAMEFIEDALPITKFAEEQSLTERQRVELFLPVCDAVHYGHQRGVIHRDLKPGNILVGGDKRPRVIDFGVARTTGADLSMAALETAAHEIIGTLRYMSPEQCAGNANEVDVRCDVYALGVVLYETLMGRLPYDFKSTSLLEIPRVIMEATPRRLGAESDSDLETIVLKALEKPRERRYQSVSELASDLRRYLNGEPIEAKHDRKWYVLRKTMQQYRAAVGIAGAFFVLVAAAAVALGLLYTRAERNAQTLRRVGYFQSIALAEHALDLSRTDELRRLLRDCPSDLRGWEWRYLNRRIDESVDSMHSVRFRASAVSPDGRLFASGRKDGVVEIWDIASRERIGEHPTDAEFFEAMSFSPDGELLALSTRSSTTSYVLDTRTGEFVLEFPPSERVKSVLMLPDSERIVTGSSDGRIEVRSLETGEVLQTMAEGGHASLWVTALGLSRDAKTLACGRNNGAIETWDLGSGEPGYSVLAAHDARVSALVFSADGTRLHSAGWDASVKMWNQLGEQIDIRQTEGDLVRGLSLSPDGDLLAVVTTTTIELRDPQDGKLVRRVLGQTNGYGAAFLPENAAGDQLLTWSGTEAKVWNLEAPRGADIFARHNDLVDSLATSPDGRWIASAVRAGAVTLWDAQTAEPHAGWSARARSRVYRLAFSPSGERLAGAGLDGSVWVWSVPDAKLEHEFRTGQPVFQTQWCDDDMLLAVSQDALSAWSCEDGAQLWTVSTAQGGLDSVAYTQRGRRIATGGDDGSIRLWSLARKDSPPTHLQTIPAHAGAVNDLAFSPDGGLLASGGSDHVVRLWGPEGRMRAELVGHNGLIKGVDFNADGSRLATSAWEGEIRLWETEGGTCLLRLRGHVGVVMDVEFTADDQRLFSVGNDGTVRVWEADRAEQGAES